MDMTIKVQILDKAVCANVLGKSIESISSPSAMVAQSAGAVEYTDCFSAEGLETSLLRLSWI